MKRFSNILLVADTGADHSVALHHSLQLARSNHASLTVVGVVEDVFSQLPPLDSYGDLTDIAVTEKRENLDDVIRSIADPDLVIQAKVLVGRPFIEIIRHVVQFDHDLVIKVAEEELGLRSILFGSTDMHLLRKCPCPVWITKSTETPHYRRILAGLDYDPEATVTDALNRQILEMSTSLALSEFSELHIVHAWQLACESFIRSPRTALSDAEVDVAVAETEEQRRCWLEHLVTAYGVKADKDAIDYLNPQLHLTKGPATRIVPATARELDVDLVIMGTVGRSGIPGFFMGNTAENILAQLNCSVLAVKPPGFVSPVTPQL